jgi:hypothetical protein
MLRSGLAAPQHPSGIQERGVCKGDIMYHWLTKGL